ncbi:DUF7556 family protein [Natrinema pallidum]|uniref:Uncharacterized protein n=1 Tax=Natrinema pallidum DSM 3751 TaxID=1227495 RepID=L9YEF1_9EURY|nr:hypothetical protein [Natrinema pallidum]ELY72026.1 hypothetical protein C487_19463 [Natrinema pallidum DSM 3751]
MSTNTRSIPIESISPRQSADHQLPETAFGWRDDLSRIVVPVPIDESLDEAATLRQLRVASAIAIERREPIVLVGICTRSRSECGRPTAVDTVGSVVDLQPECRRLEQVVAELPPEFRSVTASLLVAPRVETAIDALERHQSVGKIILRHRMPIAGRPARDNASKHIPCDVIVSSSTRADDPVYVPRLGGHGVELVSAQSQPDRLLLAVDEPLANVPLATNVGRGIAHKYRASLDIVYRDDTACRPQEIERTALSQYVRHMTTATSLTDELGAILRDGDYDAVVGPKTVIDGVRREAERAHVEIIAILRNASSDDRTESEIMGAVDEAATGPLFVIADTSTDDAWVSAPVSDSYTAHDFQ